MTTSDADVERHKVAVRRLVEEVMNRGRLDVITEIYTPAATAAARNWIESFLNSFGERRDADR